MTDLGASVGLWKTLKERATEVGEVERKPWEASAFGSSPAKPETLMNCRLPGISPMARSLTRRKSVKQLGNIGIGELATW